MLQSVIIQLNSVQMFSSDRGSVVKSIILLNIKPQVPVNQTDSRHGSCDWLFTAVSGNQILTRQESELTEPDLNQVGFVWFWEL